MGSEKPSFQSDVDWSDINDLTDEEAANLVEWYAESHGDGDVNLTPFVPFFIAERRGAFKRYRRQAVANRTEAALPIPAVAFVMQHAYVVAHNELGVYYTAICARNWGATKQEVLDVLEFGFNETGPLGGNAAGGRAAEYLANWPDDEPRRTGENPWPGAWALSKPPPPPRIDFTTSEISSTELESLSTWYEARFGAESSVVKLLERDAPFLIKPMIHRYVELFASTSVPYRLFPLLRLNVAAIHGHAAEIELAAAEAKRSHVTKPEALESLYWALLASPEVRRESAAERLIGPLSDWPS